MYPDMHEVPERPYRVMFSAKSAPFILAHLAALLVFVVPFSWKWVALCVGLYFVRMFGITGGYHRYFSHRSYKTSRPFQLVLALLGLSSMQKGPLWWAANHRHHHRHSDHEPDIHSPTMDGFFWSHVGWVLDSRFDATDMKRVADLARYPELVWLNKHHWVPGVSLAVACFALGGMPALVWGFFLSTVLTWHGTFCINSLTHMIGSRRYDIADDSKNSFLLALITLGEGWHNNHHYYKSSTRQGFYWWEIDITYYILRGLAAVGLVWDLKEPSEEIRAGSLVEKRRSPGVPQAAAEAEPDADERAA